MTVAKIIKLHTSFENIILTETMISVTIIINKIAQKNLINLIKNGCYVTDLRFL